jgi:hypothetical protein
VVISSGPSIHSYRSLDWGSINTAAVSENNGRRHHQKHNATELTSNRDAASKYRFGNNRFAVSPS